MKSLRKIISWILVLTLCCGEFTPQLAVYAAGEEAVLEGEDTAVSSDETVVSGDEAVSEDAAVSEDKAVTEEEEAVSDNEAVPGDEEIMPEDEEDPAGEEWETDYDDGLISEDVAVEEETDDDADSYAKLTFKMKYDQKEGRLAGVSINAIRKEKNLVPLTYDNGIETKACLRAAEAAIYYSITRPDGRDFSTIYNDVSSSSGKKKKEILIRDGATGAEAANYFRSVSFNSLISGDYYYMAVGHVVFQGRHYWALELSEFPVNLADRNARVEDVNVTMDVLEKYISGKDVTPSLAAGTKIKVDTNVGHELPTFKGYIISKEHKPDNGHIPVVMDAATWTADKKLKASIKNNKFTVGADEGTDGNITATQKLANKEFTFNYPVHVIIHVKEVSISVNELTLPLDYNTTATVKVLPVDADDTSFEVISDNPKIIRVEKPAKKGDPYVLKGVGAGKTKVKAVANDQYNKNKKDGNGVPYTVEASQEVNVDGEDEMCEVYATPGDCVISKDTKVRLTCETIGAEIYYLVYNFSVSVDEAGFIEWEYSDEDLKKRDAVYTPDKDTEDNKYFTRYSEPITVSGNCFVRTVAVKKALNASGNEAYKISNYNDWLFMRDENDWGDVITLDREGYETPADLPAGLWVAEASMPEVSYTGKALKPDTFRVYFNNKRLYLKKDYTIKYSNNVNASTATSSANACFKFKGNFNAQLNKSFSIAPADITASQVSKAGAVYTGEQIDPKPTVTLGGKKLKRDVDFKIAILDENLVETGKYTIYICGIGNYTGVLEHEYTITQDKKLIPPAEKLENFKKAVTVKLSQEVYDFSPEGCYPSVSVNKGNEVLTEGVDYLVTYKNGDKAGKATVVVTGLESAGYKGNISKKYKINKINIANGKYEVYPDIMAIYKKGGAEMDLYVGQKVGDDMIYLRKDIDYTVKYTNNKKVANQTDKKAPTYTIEGKGGYKGKLGPYKFSIIPQAIGNMQATATDVVWKNQPGNYKCKPVIYDTTGKKLKAGTDYDKKFAYRYDENCYVSIKGKAQKEFRVAGAPVEDNEIPDAGTLLHVSIEGKGNYNGHIHIRYRIVSQSITKFKAGIADQTYTGDEITLNRSDIHFNNGLKTTDFEIVSYSNNVEAGKASVTVRGLGNYGGTLTIKFNIVKLEKKNWIANWKGILFAD